MKTVKDVFATYRDELKALYDRQEINSITTLLLSDLTDLNTARLKAFPETVLTNEQAAKVEDALTRLKTGMPLQYILGTTSFFGLNFKVNPSVLIPRPETEELVEWIIKTIQESGLTAGSILDIGTGSGCIAIALKTHLPTFTITAVDISEGALDTARQNATLNGVEVNFIKADILQADGNRELNKYFDIIVSNPPYVTLADKQLMHKNVTEFEPHTALFVPENDPLIFYRHIVHFAINHLRPDGNLFFEINEGSGEETLQLMNNNHFKISELKQDFRDKDRMIRGVIVHG